MNRSLFRKETDFLFRTRSVFIWTRLLNVPFWVIFNMLAIILYKDLGATPLQITAIVAIKPVASLLSPYWCVSIAQRKDRLVSNLVWGNILKFLPFLFFPWINNVWLFIISYGFYMVFFRGMIPAWMEIIKLNIKEKTRERVLAIGSTIDYVSSAILPIAFGWLLDEYQHSWRWLFFGTGCLGIASTLFLLRLPKHQISSAEEATLTNEPFSWKTHVMHPWKAAWRLMQERPDFARFQIGFMLGGSALMMMQTSLPMFFIDILNLSFTEIMFAIAICKAIGFLIGSPFWVRWFDQINLFDLSGRVTIVATLFPIMLLLATWHVGWVYAAYLTYGIMQAGSELSWHLSGPVFAKDQDSSVYSSMNVLTVGIRGCVAPLLGSLIYMGSNAVVVLLISSVLCLLATERMWSYRSSIPKPDPAPAP